MIYMYVSQRSVDITIKIGLGRRGELRENDDGGE
jgi:hypothetical protein